MLLDLIYDILKGYLAIVAIWLATLVIVLITLFKRKDLMFPTKIFWTFIIFIAPVIGLIIYFVYGLKGKKKVLTSTESNFEGPQHGRV